MKVLVIAVSKHDAEVFAEREGYTDFVWVSPKSRYRARGVTVDAIFATDGARRSPEFDSLVEETAHARRGHAS